MLLIALALAAIEPPPPRPMTVEVVRDAINDRIRANANLYDAGQRLTLACDPARYDGVRVTVTSNNWLSRGFILTSERPLLYRFDDEPLRRLIWVVHDRTAQLAGRKRVTQFIRQMIGAERLVFRTRDVEEHRLDLTFRLIGARVAVDQLLDVCGESRVRTELFGPPAV
jgi:hypothetical protein